MKYQAIQGDCLKVMQDFPDNSVDAIITDPPYFQIVDDEWDNAWKNLGAFMEWYRLVAVEWHRILRRNGSLFVFCGPRTAGRIETMMAEMFNILNHIVLTKETGTHNKANIESLRSWFPASERAIFAEHYGADSYAKGESGYIQECDKLRGMVFEPIRAYLAEEVAKAGHTTTSINNAWRAAGKGTGGMAGHWLGRSQWQLPTREHYEWLRELLNSSSLRDHETLKQEHTALDLQYKVLRAQYDDLRKQYEDLRRPFQLPGRVNFTDVWAFNTQGAVTSHPCEKPVDVMEFIVRACTRPGGIVLDSFMGTGATGVACGQSGREFIGIEKDEGHLATAAARIDAAYSQLSLFH